MKYLSDLIKRMNINMSRHSTGTPDISGYSCNVAEPEHFMAGSCTSITNVATHKQFQLSVSESDPSTAPNLGSEGGRHKLILSSCKGFSMISWTHILNVNKCTHIYIYSNETLMYVCSSHTAFLNYKESHSFTFTHI
jgi:hypothetical protein